MRCFLVADIGGTNARFALAHQQGETLALSRPTVFQTADHATLDEALALFLEGQGQPALDAVAVCAAGPLEGRGASSRITFTNCPWEVSVASLAAATSVAAPSLMNDFAALASAVPHLKPDELRQIGGSEAPEAEGTKVVMGAGTGLGVATLIWSGSGYIVNPGEGGHVDLAPTTPREMAIHQALAAKYGHVSVERVLSGPGLVTLYETMSDMAGQAPTAPLRASDIAEKALAGTCPLCMEAIALFTGWLGAVAGDLALIMGARGGIYIGGGIVPGWLRLADRTGQQLFDAALFRSRFEAKGGFEAFLARIPVYAIMRDDTALLGLAQTAARSLL